MVMMYTNNKIIMKNIVDSLNAKSFLNFIVERFGKVKIIHYFLLMDKTIFDSIIGICDCVMRSAYYYNHLKNMKMQLEIGDLN